VGEHLLDQRSEDGVLHRSELQQTRVQTLQLRLRERIEIHTRGGLGRSRPLQPPQQDLGRTRIGHRPLPQTTLDLGVTKGQTATAACAGRVPGDSGTPGARRGTRPPGLRLSSRAHHHVCDERLRLIARQRWEPQGSGVPTLKLTGLQVHAFDRRPRR
jgi:hypothetical protein